MRIKKLMGGVILVALVLGSAWAPAQAFAQSHFPTDEDLEVMLRYLVEDGETPGIVLGLLEADGSTRVLWHGSAGDGARALGPGSVFEMGSITKAFTGILLASAVKEGLVSLEDPVSAHLPAEVTMPSWEGTEITLLDLATHHSSLPRMPDNMERGSDQYPEYSIPELYEFLSSHTLRREIGSEYEYSNIAVALLGHVLERVFGASYEELLRTRILDPLGMEQTSTRVEGEIRDWLTVGHTQAGTPAPYRNWPDLPAMGALRSNAEDMLMFLAANIEGADSGIEDILREAQIPRASVNEGSDMGLNWQVRQLSDRRIISHGGGTAGFSTLIAFDPDLGVGVVRLTNTRGFGDDIGMDILRRGVPLDLGDVSVDPETLRGYVGQYEVAPGEAFVIRLEEEGWLTMQAPGNVRFRMYAESESSFYVRRTPWRFTFERDGDGAVTGIEVDLEGRGMYAKRASSDTPSPRLVAGNAPAMTENLPPLPAEEMVPYEGTYELNLGERTLDVRIYIEDARLMMQPSGQSASALLFQGDHTFVAEVDTGIRLVFIVEGAQAQAFILHQSGREVRAERR